MNNTKKSPETEIEPMREMISGSAGEEISFYKSLFICKNISRIENPTENELIAAGSAIKNLLEMPTHNSISKKDMLNIIKFLWYQIYEYEEEPNEKSRNYM